MFLSFQHVGSIERRDLDIVQRELQELVLDLPLNFLVALGYWPDHR